MTNKFQVDIIGRDRYTKAFAGLRTAAALAMTPLNSLAAASGKVFNVRGTQALVRGMSNVTMAAERASAAVGAMPGGLVGIGSKFAIGAAVAGVASLVNSWGDLSTSVLRSSRDIGVNAQALQEWAYAAKAAGHDSEAMRASMAGVGQTLHDVKWGRNTGAAMVLQKLGIDPKKGVTGVMEDLSRVFAKVKDPYTRAAISRELGIGPDTAQFLSKGPSEVSARRAEVRGKPGLIQSDAELLQAEKQVEAKGGVSNAWESIKNKASEVGSSAVTGVLGGLPGFMEWLRTGKRPGALTVPEPQPRAPGAPTPDADLHGALGYDPKTGRMSNPRGKEPKQATQVEINVNIPNAPAGTTVRARSNDGTPLRVSKPMQAGSP